eukprot:4911311-Prorocentrum_lima.AAC.1
MYGLQGAFLTKEHLRALDVFQMKGLRRILHLQTTFVNRANSNAMVLQKAEEAINVGNRGTWRS